MGRERREKIRGEGDDYCSVSGHVMTRLDVLSKMAPCYILCCVCVGRKRISLILYLFSSTIHSLVHFVNVYECVNARVYTGIPYKSYINHDNDSVRPQAKLKIATL